MVSMLLPSPECHIVGILQDITFSDWILLFNNMHLFSPMSFHDLLAYFLLILHHLDVPEFIHSPAKGHFGYFQVLAVMNV